jgi:hypothetical protein
LNSRLLPALLLLPAQFWRPAVVRKLRPPLIH